MYKVYVFFISLLFCLPSVFAQSDRVKLKYVEPPGDEVIMYHYGVKLSGPFQNKYGTIRMVHCVKGETTVTVLNEKPFALTDTVQFLDFQAHPYKRDSVRISILPAIADEIQLKMEDTLHDILMETFSEKGYILTDTIPIMAFSTGVKYKTISEGKEVEGISLCNLRNARKHPSKWYELFDIQNYIYFELLIE